MANNSIKHSLPSAEHTVRDGIEGKVCRGNHSRGTEHWVALSGYWSNDSYKDDRADTCAACYGIRRRERNAAEPKGEHALTLRDARPVVFDDGTCASVGWHGDVEYFPITPLLSVTRYKTEESLLRVIRKDPHMGATPLPIKVLAQDGKQREVWHLPWSHFSTFCLKFGNARTKPQQERVQKVIEAAFGHTAKSNQVAVARIDQGDTVVWEENRQQHGKTQKLIEQMRDDLRGATLYKDRVLVIRGSVYFIRLWPEMPVEVAASLIAIPFAAEMWRKGYRLYKVGKTGKKAAADRLKQYATEARMVPPVQIAEIHVDDPDEAERLLKRLRPSDALAAEGCAEQFWCKPGIEERVRRSWAKHPTIAVEDMALRMRGWEIGAPVVIEQMVF
jgi:hypothetical protein